MDEGNSQQPETPAPEPLEAIEPGEEQAETQPRAAGSFLRRALQWGAGIGVVFLLGVLVVFVMRVRPQSDQIKSLQRSLDENQQESEELRSQLQRLEPLEEENQQLQAELAVKDRHLDLLAVLVDVTRARLALAQDQPGSAESFLGGTGSRLRSLEDGLEGEQEETVRAMRDRLGLVLQELETDTFAAERDLEILANNLVELEQTVFGD